MSSSEDETDVKLIIISIIIIIKYKLYSDHLTLEVTKNNGERIIKKLWYRGGV